MNQIEFKEQGTNKNKPMFYIYANDGEWLGRIFWHQSKYVFESSGGCVLDENDLNQIRTALVTQTLLRK